MYIYNWIDKTIEILKYDRGIRVNEILITSTDEIRSSVGENIAKVKLLPAHSDDKDIPDIADGMIDIPKDNDTSCKAVNGNSGVEFRPKTNRKIVFNTIAEYNKYISDLKRYNKST